MSALPEKYVAALFLGLLAAGGPSAIQLRAAEGSAGGSITGTLGSAQAAKSAAAIDRSCGKTYQGHVDPQTGRFTVSGLAVDASYDCIIDFDRARLEGVDLTVPASDYEEEQPLSPEDVATIADKVRRMNKFEDVVEIKTIQGNIQHAAVLLNKLRTRPFYGAKPGEVIWRAELWHFERPEETWLKVQDELFVVLYRERIAQADYARKSLTFDAALGGLKLTSRQPNIDLGSVQPPPAGTGVHYRNAEHETGRSRNAREGTVE